MKSAKILVGVRRSAADSTICRQCFVPTGSISADRLAPSRWLQTPVVNINCSGRIDSQRRKIMPTKSAVNCRPPTADRQPPTKIFEFFISVLFPYPHIFSSFHFCLALGMEYIAYVPGFEIFLYDDDACFKYYDLLEWG